MKKTRRLLLTLLMAAVLAVAAFGAPASAAEKVLTIVLPNGANGMDTFDPYRVQMLNDSYYLVYDRLVEKGSDGKFYPSLMTAWDISADGLTWVMSLKKGVKFHDGSDFNAAVAKWHLENVAKGESGYLMAAAVGYEIRDDYTLVMKLKYPDPNLLYNLSSSFSGIPSMVAHKKYGKDYGRKHVVGSGPFIFKSWKAGDAIVLTKNPAYTWGCELSDNRGPAKVDKVVFREILEESARFLELKTGGVDILMSAPTVFLGKIKKDKTIHLVQMPSMDHFHMVMNTKKELLKDLKIRKAIALAIDQDAILKSVFQGYGATANTYLINNLPARQVDKKFEIHHDLAAGKVILDKLGWKPGADGVREKKGKRLELALWTQSETSYRKIAEVVQAQLSKLGVDAKINQLDPSTIRTQLRSGKQDLVVRSYGWDNADILEWFFNSKRLGYPNAAMWHDNESDYLMQKAMTRSKNAQERIDNFKAYHEYLLGKYVWAPIYVPTDIHAINQRVKAPAPRFKKLIGPPILDMDL